MLDKIKLTRSVPPTLRDTQIVMKLGYVAKFATCHEMGEMADWDEDAYIMLEREVSKCQTQ